MNKCLSMVEARHWAEQGNHLPIPGGLRTHAERCAACADFIRTVDDARTLGQQLPTTPLGQQRHDAMKFQLMATARQQASRALASNHPVRIGARLLIAAFVVTAAATAGGYAVKAMRDRNVPSGANRAAPAQQLSHLETARVNTNIGARLASAAATASSPSASMLGSANAEPAGATTPTNIDGDARFTEAWAALRAKRPAEAARNFDALLDSNSLDAARRADILYWSAQSHRQAGNVGAAQSRSAQLLRQYPSSPFAGEAALILGEYALANGQFDTAAKYLTRAADSDRPVVRDRAKRALKELVKKEAR